MLLVLPLLLSLEELLEEQLRRFHGLRGGSASLKLPYLLLLLLLLAGIRRGRKRGEGCR